MDKKCRVYLGVGWRVSFASTTLVVTFDGEVKSPEPARLTDLQLTTRRFDKSWTPYSVTNKTQDWKVSHDVILFFWFVSRSKRLKKKQIVQHGIRPNHEKASIPADLEHLS